MDENSYVKITNEIDRLCKENIEKVKLVEH